MCTSDWTLLQNSLFLSHSVNDSLSVASRHDRNLNESILRRVDASPSSLHLNSHVLINVEGQVNNLSFNYCVSRDMSRLLNFILRPCDDRGNTFSL